MGEGVRGEGRQLRHSRAHVVCRRKIRVRGVYKNAGIL
jgi:hypothetical protein